MKVYLQYPWKFPDSPYYKYLIKDTIEDLEYKNIEKEKGVITSKRFFWLSNFLKKKIRKYTKILYPSMLNSHLTPTGDYDLIHSAHSLSENKDKPWVSDMEAFWQLWVSTIKTKKGLRKVEEVLSRDNCKKIMPWTKEVENKFLTAFPNLKDKLEVVYPAIPSRNIKKEDKKEVLLIFSGRYFYWKGGLHALEVIDFLTKKYPNVKGVINSEVPEEVKKKYSKNEKIEFYPLMPQEKLFELYERADILIYPGYTDSFGFAYLEVMGFGIPIITVDGCSRKEIVTEGKTGFVLNRPDEFSWYKIGDVEKEMIDEMVKKTEILIEDKILRKEMSDNCLKEISEGKFSIKERNKKLERIYLEAVQ